MGSTPFEKMKYLFTFSLLLSGVEVKCDVEFFFSCFISCTGEENRDKLELHPVFEFLFEFEYILSDSGT